MTQWNIGDFRLSAAELQAKYDPTSVGDEHPAYTSAEWRCQVADGYTRQGYWDWVWGRLYDEEAELDGCNPYTEYTRGIE